MAGSDSPPKAAAPQALGKCLCQPSCSSPAPKERLSGAWGQRAGPACPAGSGRGRRCGTAGAGSDTRPGGREQVRNKRQSHGGAFGLLPAPAGLSH